MQLISVLGEFRGLGYVHLKDFDTAGDAEALLKRSDQSTVMINRLIAMATEQGTKAREAKKRSAPQVFTPLTSPVKLLILTRNPNEFRYEVIVIYIYIHILFFVHKVTMISMCPKMTAMNITLRITHYVLGLDCMSP